MNMHARDHGHDETCDAPRQRRMQRARRDALYETEHAKIEQADGAGEQRQAAEMHASR